MAKLSRLHSEQGEKMDKERAGDGGECKEGREGEGPINTSPDQPLLSTHAH